MAEGNTRTKHAAHRLKTRQIHKQPRGGGRAQREARKKLKANPAKSPVPGQKKKDDSKSRVKEALYRLFTYGSPDGYWSFEPVGARALMPDVNEGSRSTEIETDVMQHFFKTYAQAIIGFNSDYLEEAVQQILKVWKLDVGVYAQTREAYKTVEEHLQTNTNKWPNKLLRKSVLARLVRFALDQVLNMYGYHIVAWMAPELKIETLPDAGNALPDWLDHDCFVIENIWDSEFDLAGGEISGPGGPRSSAGSHFVKPGHQISNRGYEEIYGTLGVVMEALDLGTSSDAPNTIYVALTCAHVSTVATTTYAKETDRRSSPLHMDPTSYLHTDSSVRSFQRDCAFLKIQEHDIQQFSLGFNDYMHCGLHNQIAMPTGELDCHYFNRDTSHGFAFDPISASRRDFIEQAMLDGPLVVYKQGGTTDFTEGILFAIQDDVAPHCDFLDGYPLDPLARHHDEWIGLVQWDSPTKHFAKPGDSGSLVFAVSRTAIIPLGIHIARSKAADDISVFISLDTFCLQARKRDGLALSFPNRNIPWWVKLLRLCKKELGRGSYTSVDKSNPIKWAVRTRQWSMFKDVILDDSTECASEDPYGHTLLSYLTKMKDIKLTERLLEKLQSSRAP